jgi:uncharacterized protein (DUF2141 family)
MALNNHQPSQKQSEPGFWQSPARGPLRWLGIGANVLTALGLLMCVLPLHSAEPPSKANPSTPPVSPTPNSSQPTGGELVIRIDGLRNQDGDVCVSLFSSANAADFPQKADKAIRRQCAKINNLSMQMTIKDLTPGSYAVALLHDANRDGTPNTVYGIPSEGFGFSQNPPLDVAAPKFEATAVTVEGPRTTIKIQLNYLQ